MKFGDFVEYDIGDAAAGSAGRGYLLGHMAYAEDRSVVLLGDGICIGMPIAAVHCRVLSSGHDETARRLRDRFIARFPNALAKDMGLSS